MEWEKLTLEWVDHETCDSCNFKNKVEECKECLFYELKKDKEANNLK